MDLGRLNKFVADVVDVNAIAPGTGVSAGGYIGAMSPRQEAVNDFKDLVLSFDAEAHKRSPNQENLASLVGRVKGGLLGLNAFQVIDDIKLKTMLQELSKLTPT